MLGPGVHSLSGQHCASALGAPLPLAGRLLGTLSRSCLIQPTEANRYRMHDLLRVYAAEQAIIHEPEPARQAALTRLVDQYVSTASAAVNVLFPMERDLLPHLARRPRSFPQLSDTASAMSWLDAERANLVCIAACAARCGRHRYATHLAAAVFHYLDAGGHYGEAEAIYTYALAAARDSGDRGAEATALTNLGVVNLRQSRFAQATSHLRQALQLCQQAGDRGGEARVLVDLGLVDLRQGRYEQGRASLRQAVAAYRNVGSRSGQARALANLGIVERRLGHERLAY